MKATPAEIQKALAVLDETPRRLTALSSRADAARLRLKPDPKGWSAVDILSHLRACADVWTHSIYAMLAEANPILPDLNERKWAKAARYSDWTFAELLGVFTRQRAELLFVLRTLPFESWERPAEISGRRHTVFTQARRMAKHEAEHCGHLERLIE